MKKIRKIIITGLGTGYLPIAPGTWASAAVAGIFIAVAWAAGPERFGWTTAVMGALAVISSTLCVALGKYAEDIFGKKDPGQCTADEWAGQAIALFALPLGNSFTSCLLAAVMAFFVFRILDITKPPPCRWAERRLKHGWGILLDDIIAGVYANIICRVALMSFL